MYDKLLKTAVYSRADLTKAHLRLVFVVFCKPPLISLQQVENNLIQ
jgi:hypothetical protein